MRIGIDARLWNQTGVGRYIRNLVKYLYLLDKNNEYVLFVRSEDLRDIQLKPNRKWKIVKTDIAWHSFKEQFSLPVILKRENMDLVHFPYFSVPIFYSRPYVVTIHDLIIDHFPTGKASSWPYPVYLLKRIFYKFVMLNEVKKAARIIVPSIATRDELVLHYGLSKDKIDVIYEGGFDAVDFSSMLTQEQNLLNNQKGLGLEKGKYFLYVGNAYPHKNLDRLIQAFGSFSEKSNKNYRLVLVGKEDYFYKKLKERIKKTNVQKFISFYGQATDRELIILYRNAMAIIIPSLMEGFGLTALEAMSCRCLVLSSDIFALREVCGEAAFYFDPLNIESIVKKIETICNLNSKETKKLQELGFERAKLFSWFEMAKKTKDLYESCDCI